MEMIFKLQYDDNEYYLVNDMNITIATTDKILLKEDGDMGKLSLKNCQAIENGYDLDELFDEVDESIDYQEFDFSSFKLGFKKALEILGDKKFSEDDLREAISQTRKGMLYNKQYEDEHIQSLQQTEWDVEIVMEEKRIGGGKGYGEYEIVPELDADGCLILRRI